MRWAAQSRWLCWPCFRAGDRTSRGLWPPVSLFPYPRRLRLLRLVDPWYPGAGAAGDAVFRLAAAGLFRFSDVNFLGMKLTASFQAAVIGLAIHEGAYMAEIVRNGVQAVARGQVEAARSLGMTSWQVTWRIVIPQATRVIVPPFGNDFNHMLKTTSLASVIGVQEIFLLTEAMSATTFKTFELLSVVALNYLVLTVIWNTIQGVIETRLRAHEIDRPVRTWWQSLVVYMTPSPGGGERRI